MFGIPHTQAPKLIQNFQTTQFTTEVLRVKMEGMWECGDVTQLLPNHG